MKPEEIVHSVISFINLPLMIGFDIVAGANRHVGIPIADGFSFDWPCIGTGVFASMPLCSFAFRAGHQKQIALPAGLALILDAHRPDLVGRLHVNEDAGVVGLGRDFHETPFDGENDNC